MIVLIAGASHTGKTKLAQKLLEKYKFPYLSIDHLKMGLIRSGNTSLTPESSDEALTDYLWPIVKEMIKTAVENDQNLIIEGCYIPYDWEKDFDERYLCQIKYICLVMSKSYICNRFDDIKKYASEIEQRLDDADCTMDFLLKENSAALEMCQKYGVDYLLIDKEYEVDLEI